MLLMLIMWWRIWLKQYMSETFGDNSHLYHSVCFFINNSSNSQVVLLNVFSILQVVFEAIWHFEKSDWIHLNEDKSGHLMDPGRVTCEDFGDKQAVTTMLRTQEFLLAVITFMQTNRSCQKWYLHV